MIPYRLSLDYTLQPGWMAPFVEALRAGRAVGFGCDVCGSVSFPPVRVCACGSAAGTWQDLTGSAEIVWRTTGADGDFAFAQFDGASGAATVRLLDMPEGQRTGHLIAAPGDLPQLCLAPPKEPAP